MGSVPGLRPDPFPAIAASRRRTTPGSSRTSRTIPRSPWRWSRQCSCSPFRIPLWAARVDHRPSESEALVVQVTAEQFAWNAHYAGPDGVFGRTDIKLLDLQSNPLGLDRTDPAAKDDVTTLNQIYLPANKPVIVKLRSKDVIHSFGVPELRVKQDAVPGLTIPIWFVPNVTTAEMRAQTGNPEFQYEIACAQLCGLGHFRMRGFVTVQTAEEFQKWMADEVEKLKGESDIFPLQNYPNIFGVGIRAPDPVELATVTRSRPPLRQDSSTALTTMPRTNAGIFFMRAAAASSHATVAGDSGPYSISRARAPGDGRRPLDGEQGRPGERARGVGAERDLRPSDRRSCRRRARDSRRSGRSSRTPRSGRRARSRRRMSVNSSEDVQRSARLALRSVPAKTGRYGHGVTSPFGRIPM